MSALVQGVKQQQLHSLPHRAGAIAPHQTPAQGLSSENNHEDVSCPACCCGASTFNTQASKCEELSYS